MKYSIAQYVPYGKENAVSRAELCKLTGYDDRRIRDEIKKANNMLEEQNEAIISSSGKRGYWRTNDIKELEEYERECRNRCRKIAENLMPVVRILCRETGESLIPVRGYMRRVRMVKKDA